MPLFPINYDQKKDYLTDNICSLSKRTPLAPLQTRVLETNTKYSIKPHKAYYLSPLEAESIRHKRAKEFGLSPPPTDSFLHNQSFPGPRKSQENGTLCTDMNNIHRCSIDKFRGDELNSISFSSFKNPQHEEETASNRQLDGSFMLYKYIENNLRNPSLHSYAHNPNKAIVTINAHTTEILTANRKAVQLLCIKESDKHVKLSNFIISPEDQYLLTEADLKPNGEIVLFSGKVMNLVTRCNETIPVSMWAKQLPSESDLRCLVIMEPVERLTGTFKFDPKGTIVDCDQDFANMYGYETTDEIMRMNIKDFIPSLELKDPRTDFLSEEGFKICAVGKTKDNFKFPLNISIHRLYMPDKSSDLELGEGFILQTLVYEGIVWVFSNISGLITILPNGIIHSCNTNFSMMLFGYSQNELVGKDISMLISTFYEDVEFWDTNSVALPPFDDDEDSNAKCGNSDGRTTADSFVADPPRPTNPLGKLFPDESDENYDLPCSSAPKANLSSVDTLLSKGDSHGDEESKIPSAHFQETATDCDIVKIEEQSASTSNNSRHMSCSESQDTLHSGTNSITESDVNANVLKSAEDGDCSDSSFMSKIAACSEQMGECDSFESECNTPDSERSENEEELYDSESESYSENENCSSYEEKDVCSSFPCDCKYDSVSPPETHSCDCLKLPSSRIKISTPVHSSHVSKSSHDVSKSSHDVSNQSIPEGVYLGIGRHKDGSDLAIQYYIKKILLDTSKFLYCIWVSRDPKEIQEGSPVTKKSNGSHYDASKTSQSSSEETESSSSSSSFDEDYLAGPFSDHYTVIQHLGKGAFGCVKKAYRNSDGLLVIAKFIKKSEVYKEAWVFDNKFNKRVPLEISLLVTINHPNIVEVIDVFENEQCFNLVMEKHGSGMDLFEFIERSPKMDESLASFIFRQMVSAVSYLHNLNILHRDIKDENAIIDENFHVKLIDFGSAAFMSEELFSVFCGTTEYCSPEVLRGEKYKGPELEMFSLGVTLFTLVLGQNPFVGADEILKGEYTIDQEISESLTGLIEHMLEPNPKKRCTLPEVESHPWVNQPVIINSYRFCDVVSASEDELHPVKFISLPRRDNDVESSNSTDLDLSFLEKKTAKIELAAQSNSSSESDGESIS